MSFAVLAEKTDANSKHAQQVKRLQQAIEGMMKGDSNGDGILTEDEVPMGFSLFDADKNGEVDREELKTFMIAMFKPFAWVNPPIEVYPGLKHSTFSSPSVGQPVGYNIYLPPGYDAPENSEKRYPVVYYLHGGRPGNESRSVAITPFIHQAIESKQVAPMVYVFVNGGKVSHYNHGEHPGETVFIKELIPHIDQTYRTVAERGGRALQGFSQGGRGTTRIMFKYPKLFISAAPGGPGYAVEKQIAENDGVEHDTRGANAARLDFGRGNDAYSLARGYAKQPQDLKILIWLGTKDFNYEATLEYLGFLYGLNIPVERLVLPDVPHNPMMFYEKQGVELMKFHEQHWAFE
ncbi:MAG: alpha/beta hydrolase-fold protein [Pseudomonadota bacterium]